MVKWGGAQSSSHTEPRMDCVAPPQVAPQLPHKISPLYAKGAAWGSAVVPTDLATEHLHTLQNGLVTHG